MEHDAVLDHECAHARPFTMVPRRVDSARCRELILCCLAASLLPRTPKQLGFTREIVLDAITLLPLRERNCVIRV